MFAMQEEDFEREVKVVVVGNGGVGKTSLIRQFCKGYYPVEYKKTIGVDFLEKNQYLASSQEQVKLMLWDTAGQEVFDSMTRAYYRGAKAAVLCFCTENRASFESIKSWKKKVEEECGKIPMVLVQNKLDLLEQATVSRQEAEALAEQLGLRFYRICVKQNLYVADVFEYLAELHLQMESSSVPASTGKRRSVLSTAFAQQQQETEKFHRELRTTATRVQRREVRETKKVFRDCSIL